MSKKIYDLSVENMAADERKILISDTGKKYDVSFRPAIFDRKIYKAWADLQLEIMKKYNKYQNILNKINDGVITSAEENKFFEEFIELTKEAAQAGSDAIVFIMKANGHDDFTEDDLYTNFSEKGMNKALEFIMDRQQDTEEDKKKE